MGIEWKDSYTQAVAHLCERLDGMLYIPFRKCFDDTDFGHKKELFKQIIEDTINKLRGE